MANNEMDHDSWLKALRSRAAAKLMVIREHPDKRPIHEALYDLVDDPKAQFSHEPPTKWAEGRTLDDLEAILDKMGAPA